MVSHTSVLSCRFLIPTLLDLVNNMCQNAFVKKIFLGTRPWSHAWEEPGCTAVPLAACTPQRPWEGSPEEGSPGQFWQESRLWFHTINKLLSSTIKKLYSHSYACIGLLWVDIKTTLLQVRSKKCRRWALPYSVCSALGSLPGSLLDATVPKKTPVSEIPETPLRLCAKVHLLPSWAILLSTRVLEKERLENLSRNIPSIASACVTWQNSPNANPLNDSLRLFFFEVWELSVFATSPWRSAEHSSRWSNPSCPEPPKHRTQHAVSIWNNGFPKAGLCSPGGQWQPRPDPAAGHLPPVSRCRALGAAKVGRWAHA